MPPTRIYTDEQRKERNREKCKKYRDKNKEKIKEYREKNIDKCKETQKKYREENKERAREYKKKWSATENGIKLRRISDWKQRGMICEDFDSVCEIYIHTWICEWCLFEFKNTTDRHLDHNHQNGEIRGILCRECNFKDVLHN